MDDDEEYFDGMKDRALEELNTIADPEVDDYNLANALYTFSELHIWPDEIDSMSEEQAIMVWKLVEYVRTNQHRQPDIWPESLRM